MNKEEINELLKEHQRLKEELKIYEEAFPITSFFMESDLQKENQRLKEAVDGLCQETTELKERIKMYEDPDDLFLMFMWCDEKAKDKIKELQQRIDNTTKFVQKLSSVGRGCEIYADVKRDILHNLKGEEK